MRMPAGRFLEKVPQKLQVYGDVWKTQFQGCFPEMFSTDK